MKLILSLLILCLTTSAAAANAKKKTNFKRTLWIGMGQDLAKGFLISEVREEGMLRVYASEWTGRRVADTKRLLKDDFDFFATEFTSLIKPFATREPPNGCLRPIVVSVQNRDLYACLDGRLQTDGRKITALLEQLR